MLSIESRRKIFYAIIVLLILLLIWLLWFLFGGKEAVVEVSPEPKPSQVIREIPSTAPTIIAPVTPGVASAQVVARDFVERFATYSTDVPYANFDDIEELVTPEFFASLKRSAVDESVYRGVTARVLSISTVSGSETAGNIVFELSVQKEVFESDRANPKTSYENIKVTVEKRNGVWKVSAYAKN